MIPYVVAIVRSYFWAMFYGFSIMFRERKTKLSYDQEPHWCLEHLQNSSSCWKEVKESKNEKEHIQNSV